MSSANSAGPNTILPERAPPLALPLGFFLTAVLFLAALLGIAIWKAPLLAQDYLHNRATLPTGFLHGDPYLLLAAHLALGLGGWFGLMIVGVGLKLVPMFAPATPLPGWFVGVVGGALAVGVASLPAGLPLGHNWLWPGAVLMAVGALGYAGGVTCTGARAHLTSAYGSP